jgi:hypothetical protein
MLELEPTEDILAAVAAAAAAGRPHQAVSGRFAAETGSLGRAADKLVRKASDLLIANDVAEEGSGSRRRHEPCLDPVGGRRRGGPADLIEARRRRGDPGSGRRRALDARDHAAQTGPVTQEIRS